MATYLIKPAIELTAAEVGLAHKHKVLEELTHMREDNHNDALDVEERLMQLELELKLLPGISQADLAIAQAQAARLAIPGVAAIEREIRSLRNAPPAPLAPKRAPPARTGAVNFDVNAIIAKHGSYSNTDGRLILSKTLQDHLGRKPTHFEYQDWRYTVRMAGIL